jgi:rSAM/selenodomain-associated transferase 2
VAVAAADPVRISVIIPALNEAAGLPHTLAVLQGLRHRGHEVILVDGGSRDATVDVSRPLVDTLLQTAPGRAVQMRAGAQAANGSVFWFLHADTRAPEHADRLIAAALQDGSTRWGRFDVQLSERRVSLRLVAALMNTRSRLSGIATGDQGIFVQRTLYEAAGGFPPLPLMEDIALSRTLRRHGRPAALRQRLRSSARRWEKHGVIRTILLMWSLRLAYFAGVTPDRLARYYQPHLP